MPKNIRILCSVLLVISICSSVAFSLQTAKVAKEVKYAFSYDSALMEQSNWQDILNNVAQFRKVVVKSEETKTVTQREPQISDGQIVGIILGQPRSVIMMVEGQGNNFPFELKEGESWLQNWFIQTINADTVLWINQQTEQTYLQTLFSVPENRDGSLTMSNSEN
ncbi:MAG: hypothetical protein GW763_06195 [Paraglaciecola sp.]|nr:hypothetical protein [Paraglaciecola sp.]NCT47574.1 hypothetical protein [Paraglaciecola sp.]